MTKKREVIKFLKSREVKSPSRGYPTDAGIDFYVPVFNRKFIKDFKDKNPSLIPEPQPQYNGLAYSVGTVSDSTITLSGSGGNVTYNLQDKNDGIFKFDEEKGEPYFILPPHARVMIPSGIHSHMAEEGRALVAFNKSGVSTKYGLDVGACVVDYTYKGEIHLSLINTSTDLVRIYENQKIVQFLELPIFTSEIECLENGSDPEVYKSFFEGLRDDRGAGGFGSTDKK